MPPAHPPEPHSPGGATREVLDRIELAISDLKAMNQKLVIALEGQFDEPGLIGRVRTQESRLAAVELARAKERGALTVIGTIAGMAGSGVIALIVSFFKKS